MGKIKKPTVNHFVNKIFTRLTVIEFDGWYIQPNGNRYHKWKCLCTCGNYCIVVGKNLSSGGTKSCGCLKLEKSKEQGRINGLSTKHKENTSAYGLYSRYKGAAKSRNKEFNLTFDDFKILILNNCNYCGIEPKQKVVGYINTKGESTPLLYNGIDRVDNTKGYILDNVVTCCGNCNIMKMACSLEEFKNNIIRIYNHLNLKNMA